MLIGANGNRLGPPGSANDGILRVSNIVVLLRLFAYLARFVTESCFD